MVNLNEIFFTGNLFLRGCNVSTRKAGIKFGENFIYAEKEAEQWHSTSLELCHGCRSCGFAPTFDLISINTVGKIFNNATMLVPDTALETLQWISSNIDLETYDKPET